MLPDDVILNTRRAFNTSPTSATGYSDLGVPEGRYFAPANSASCIQLKAGDCAPRTLLIRAPFFTRVDIGVTKRFPIGGRTNAEIRFDVLNLFDNINFDPVANPAAAPTIFQVEQRVSGSDNNFDPGGRLGQMSFRLNWYRLVRRSNETAGEVVDGGSPSVTGRCSCSAPEGWTASISAA